MLTKTKKNNKYKNIYIYTHKIFKSQFQEVVVLCGFFLSRQKIGRNKSFKFFFNLACDHLVKQV